MIYYKYSTINTHLLKIVIRILKMYWITNTDTIFDFYFNK